MYLLHTYFLEIHFSLNACDVNSHENLFACTGAPILMNLRNWIKPELSVFGHKSGITKHKVLSLVHFAI